ncbi:bifunctional diaminohydroxyphosphoribosylaminopyrimidine deaminase/5-amino-6-(5-phosphoribosylamino)uracil reductase RibD [Buchnera aphidicola (Mollitrichosiphum nigrofasciatum)]|uniref:bifunctional diaminohydroxyphosphoribosylaminopyrimidine deaminase/5-amino-6-(5-phosphoribosylamino)uracil reductase RibD n=1 Tax=Buchnera aphidicola TaxID=9 RepID=UPI0031B7EC49
MNDKIYMYKAIKLAKKGKFTTKPNPNVGCIIVNKKGKIVGSGWHEKKGSPHAEKIAIKMAKKKTINSTMYITLEPCSHYGQTSPCYKKIISAKINKVVCSMIDPNPLVSGKGLKKLKKAGIEVKLGLLNKISKKINQGFIKRMQTGLPFITFKMGTSIDGRVSLKNGDSKWITSEKSRSNVQKLRAKNDAILSTSNTVIKDNALLNIRKKNILKKINTQPIRIIIDSKNKIQPNQKIIKFKSKIFLIRFKKDKKIWPEHVKQLIIPKINNKINLIHLFKLLGNKNINNLLIESGPKLFSTLLKEKIIDKLILYISPKILGNNSKPLAIIKTINLSKAIKLKFDSIKKIGEDIRIKLDTNYFNIKK